MNPTSDTIRVSVVLENAGDEAVVRLGSARGQRPPRSDRGVRGSARHPLDASLRAGGLGHAAGTSGAGRAVGSALRRPHHNPDRWPTHLQRLSGRTSRQSCPRRNPGLMRVRFPRRESGLLAPRVKCQTHDTVFALVGQERRGKPRRLRWSTSLQKCFGVDPLVDRNGQRMRWARRVPPGEQNCFAAGARVRLPRGLRTPSLQRFDRPAFTRSPRSARS